MKLSLVIKVCLLHECQWVCVDMGGGVCLGLVVVVWIRSIVMAIHNDNDEVDNIDDVVDASAADDDASDDNDEDEKANLLILVFFQNPVGVEHPSILHIFDIWTGGGGL